jgi:L-rhamnose mutarotase
MKRIAASIVLSTGLVLVLTGCAPQSGVQRYGMVIGVKPEKLDEYKKLHAKVWPEVLDQIKKSHIRNYSIYLSQINGQYYLYSYFEYTGKDYQADMAAMAKDPKTQEWWEVCKPCQIPLPNRAKDEWWMAIDEVFHTE